MPWQRMTAAGDAAAACQRPTSRAPRRLGNSTRSICAPLTLCCPARIWLIPYGRWRSNGAPHDPLSHMAMLCAHIDEFLRMLAVEENASAHTVRSYRSDL